MGKKYFFSKAGNRPVFREDDGVEDIELIVSNEQSEGRYTIMIGRWLSTFEVPPHYHKTHAETFYIVDGEVEWTVEGETHILRAGDALYVGPNVVHSVKVVGGKDMHNILIYSPGGYEAQFELKMNYTKEELEDPDIKALIRKKSDFNIPD